MVFLKQLTDAASVTSGRVEALQTRLEQIPDVLIQAMNVSISAPYVLMDT